jgi:hypothetical protein
MSPQYQDIGPFGGERKEILNKYLHIVEASGQHLLGNCWQTPRPASYFGLCWGVKHPFGEPPSEMGNQASIFNFAF